MPTYKTPGVYVEEIPKLPPSVAEVSTAVPAFIGYTEKAPPGAIARLTTLLEYRDLFGGPRKATFTVTTHADDSLTIARDTSGPPFLLYYAMSHYFKNGGGPCWVVSAGDYGTAALDKTALENALGRVEQEDEPTLLVQTDAVGLGAGDYYSLCDAALQQCHKLGDRFAIFDVKKDAQTGKTDAEVLRNGIGTQYLSYGAAYTPYLQTLLAYEYEESGVNILPAPPWTKEIAPNAIKVKYTGTGTAPSVRVVQSTEEAPLGFGAAGETLTITLPADAEGAAVATTGQEIATAFATWKGTQNPRGFDVLAAGTGAAAVPPGTTAVVAGRTLASIADSDTALYNRIKARLKEERVVLPPSAAVAGVYAAVDRDRGVWKAPANVSLTAVVEPVAKITGEEQDGLNVDPTAGKSINAIRAFNGKGTLVWGARTLAGNDNEWRYVPVRRLFLMIEESAKKATGFAVFEPNDMTTWLKVKGMIESFLYGLWERGALAGPTPASAYFVNVGLGKTMTTQDILEGRLIVEIGVAAVRPAEFIILRFSHKLQEA